MLETNVKALPGILAVFLVMLLSACASTMGPAAARQQPLVVLLTDFGERDHYVGALKGAIYSANPSARIDCITNQIDKFDIVEGAYTLAQAAREYPDGTVFVAVVDPGVGSSRKSIAVKTRNGKMFVGPDNGLLAIAAEEAGIVEVREISNSALMRSGEVSSTFHARDIFGPVAGNLAGGAPFEDVGPRVSRIVELGELKATMDNGRLVGHIVHVDDYGNLMTNIPITMVEALGLRIGSCARVAIGEEELQVWYVLTYSDVDAGTPLFLSNRGFVEAALNRGSLAGRIGATEGMEIIVERWK